MRLVSKEPKKNTYNILSSVDWATEDDCHRIVVLEGSLGEMHKYQQMVIIGCKNKGAFPISSSKFSLLKAKKSKSQPLMYLQ